MKECFPLDVSEEYSGLLYQIESDVLFTVYWDIFRGIAQVNPIHHQAQKSAQPISWELCMLIVWEFGYHQILV